jgi:hypothetical protein
MRGHSVSYTQKDFEKWQEQTWLSMMGIKSVKES